MTKILPFSIELKRKIVHMLSLFLPLIYSILEFTKHFIILMLIVTALAVLIDVARIKFKFFQNKLYYFISSIMRPYEKKGFLGSTYLLVSFCLVALLFDKQAAILAMLLTGLCDSVAAIIGLKYGKVTLIHGKTLEGSCSFLICSL